MNLETQPRKLKPRRPPLIAFGQGVVRWFFRISFTLMYQVRVHDLENYPETDGMLVCSNHISYFDPLVIGSICPRPVNYLARKSLFKFLPFAWFMSWNDTIPIDRDGVGIGGMKETLRRIKRGESVVLFPEGTRSSDGEIQPFMLGFCSIAKRCKATLMPIGTAGGFQAFSKHMKFPRPGRIHAVIGKPIPFEEYADLSDQQIADLLKSRIQECFEEALQIWNQGSWITA